MKNKKKLYKTPSYNSYKGYFVPKTIPIEKVASAVSYQATPADIFVASYPKCGTTWTLYITWLILNKGIPFPETKKLSDFTPHLEFVGKQAIETLPSPRVIKTHFPAQMVPFHSQAKYIHIVRNPFDCVVSFYHHTRGFVKLFDFEDGTFEDFFECFMSGGVEMGDYFNHVLSWYQQKNRNNILFLTYENLKDDIRREIIKIATFLGCNDITNDQRILQEIVKHSSFQNMKKNSQCWPSQRPKHMPPFLRKGEIGDWVNYFSPEQRLRLMAKLEPLEEIKKIWPSSIFQIE